MIVGVSDYRKNKSYLLASNRGLLVESYESSAGWSLSLSFFWFLAYNVFLLQWMEKWLAQFSVNDYDCWSFLFLLIFCFLKASFLVSRTPS